MLSHRFVRHRSAVSLVREKLRDQIESVGEVGAYYDSIHDGPISFEELRRAILSSGMWAFVRIFDGNAVIHWYAKRAIPLQRVAQMLGHELGHISGKQRSGLVEEMRADQYGDVAAEVFTLLMP